MQSTLMLLYASTIENVGWKSNVFSNSNLVQSPHLGSGSRETSPALFASRVKTLNKTNNHSLVFPDTW